MRTLALAAAAAAALLTTTAFAQTSNTDNSLETTAINDVEAALGALRAGDFAEASARLDLAQRTASRLNLRKISNGLAAAAPDFTIDAPKFALSESATLNLEEFIAARNVAESIARGPDGRRVTLRVITDEAAMEKFGEVADDSAMLDKEKLERVEMAGAPAVKRRGEDGSLSVLIMSEADHALIEVDGDDEESVMAFVEALENAKKD